MIQGEVKVLEKEVIVFPIKTEQQNVVPEDSEKEVLTMKNEVVEIDVRNKFARLKKSLRKRSASIL